MHMVHFSINIVQFVKLGGNFGHSRCGYLHSFLFCFCFYEKYSFFDFSQETSLYAQAKVCDKPIARNKNSPSAQIGSNHEHADKRGEHSPETWHPWEHLCTEDCWSTCFFHHPSSPRCSSPGFPLVTLSATSASAGNGSCAWVFSLLTVEQVECWARDNSSGFQSSTTDGRCVIPPLTLRALSAGVTVMHPPVFCSQIAFEWVVEFFREQGN